MRTAIFIITLLTCTMTHADSWLTHSTMQTQEHTFGQTRIVVEYGGPQPGYDIFEYHAIKIYLNEQLMALYRNVGFKEIYASEDNQFFVGLSNTGMPGTAFIVFDNKGNLIREVKHESLLECLGIYFYTRMTVTIGREWYDKDKPEIQFDIKNDRLGDIEINGSNGLRYKLLKSHLGLDPAQAKTIIRERRMAQMRAERNVKEDLKAVVNDIGDKAERCFLAGDVDGMLEYYCDDVVSMPNFHPMVKGKLDLKRKTEAILATGLKFKSLESKTIDVQGSGEMVYEIGTFRQVVLVPGAKEPLEQNGKYINIWKRQLDGKLRIAVEMYNSDADPYAKKAD